MKKKIDMQSGGILTNHNEKMESLKTLKTKLKLNKETIRELIESELKTVAGGGTTSHYGMSLSCAGSCYCTTTK